MPSSNVFEYLKCCRKTSCLDNSCISDIHFAILGRNNHDFPPLLSQSQIIFLASKSQYRIKQQREFPIEMVGFVLRHRVIHTWIWSSIYMRMRPTVHVLCIVIYSHERNIIIYVFTNTPCHVSVRDRMHLLTIFLFPHENISSFFYYGVHLLCGLVLCVVRWHMKIYLCVCLCNYVIYKYTFFRQTVRKRVCVCGDRVCRIHTMCNGRIIYFDIPGWIMLVWTSDAWAHIRNRTQNLKKASGLKRLSN